MANALEDAVETAPNDADAPPPQEGGAAGAAPKAVPEATQKTAPGAATPPAEVAAKPDEATGIPIPDRNQAPADTANHPPAALKNRYLVFPSMPLTDLDMPTASAYAVEDRREPNRQLYALVCTPGLPARTSVMRSLSNSNIPGMIPIIDYGPVIWTPLGQSCLVVILERPLGGRLIDAFEDHVAKINEYELSRRIIEPIAHALTALSAMSISHRALRVDNLYFMDKERRQLVLGECVTAPPGFDQPLIYEPLHRAMAMASGRGEGYIGDDLYALGVMTVFLLLGYNPMSKFSKDEVIALKAELGTYQSLCGNERIPLSLIEPIRGLVSDDERERWDLEAIDLWLNGQKKTPIQRRPAPKPKTLFKFAGRDHRTPVTIAQAFSKNVGDAAKLVKGGKLEQWLRQSLGDTELADSVNAIMTVAKVHEGSPDGSDDVLVSKICMRLDPHGPVRYKTFSFMPDGFGPALAVEYLRKGNFQHPGEVLARDLMGTWFASQPHVAPDQMSLDKTFQTLRNFAKINELGFGMERCLYELNRSLPCQSPLLQQGYVDHIDELLPALDEAVEHQDKRSRPMDKHIAAFVATHFKFDIQPHLRAMNAPKEETSLIGMLSLYALMQWRLKTEHLYGLSSWLGGLLQPAIGTYHSRTTRRTLEQEIPVLVRQGSLPELFDLIDNAERRTKDQHAFEDAQVLFAHAEDEINTMVGEDVDQEAQAMEAGEKVTAMASVIMGMVATAVIIFIKTM